MQRMPLAQQFTHLLLLLILHPGLGRELNMSEREGEGTVTAVLSCKLGFDHRNTHAGSFLVTESPSQTTHFP